MGTGVPRDFSTAGTGRPLGRRADLRSRLAAAGLDEFVDLDEIVHRRR